MVDLMSFDYKLLGRKLKEARVSLRIEPKEAAEYIGCSEMEYLKIEAGDAFINGDHLVLLAKLYFRDFRYFVTGDYPSAESQIKELFRRNEQLSKGDRIAIQKFVRICEYKSYFENILGRKKVVPLNYFMYKPNLNYKKQGEKAAIEERKRLEINGPIDNIYSLLRKQKINIFRRIMEDRTISGVYIKHPFAGHCILINYLDDIYRQNFSLAHEYCHVLFDSGDEQSITYFNKASEPSEVRANNFAGNFLVSEQILKSLVVPSNYKDLINFILKTCRYFKVSSQVVIFRMKNLRLISNIMVEQLLKEKLLIIPKSQKEDPELLGVSTKMRERIKIAMQGGLSLEYIELCRSVYQEGLITYGKLIESLMLPFEDAKEIMDMYSVIIEV
jgi:Zn-dependent peptidase ImmA (M78 family)/DNA-binding XRE family transcriptional regulator